MSGITLVSNQPHLFLSSCIQFALQEATSPYTANRGKANRDQLPTINNTPRPLQSRVRHRCGNGETGA